MRDSCNIGLKTLYEITKGLKLLYVEDDHVVRSVVEGGILPKLFGAFYTAIDGSEGVMMFKQYKPQIIITDINMPFKSGIEMAKEIRQIAPSAHIIMATAYSETHYLLDAIELNVDGYLIKPFKIDSLITLLHKIATSINNSLLAEKMQKIEIQERLRSSTVEAVHQTVDAMFDPVIVLDESGIKYINSRFSSMLSGEDLKVFEAQRRFPDTIFVQKEGYVSNINELIDSCTSSLKCIIKSQSGENRVYLVRCKDISCIAGEQSLRMLVLTDITDLEKQKLLIEYQKNKIFNYNEILEELLIAKYLKKQTETKESKQDVPQQTQPQCREHSADALLSYEDRELLRKKRTQFVSAKEYIEDIGDDVSDDVVTLGELQLDFSNATEDFAETSDRQTLETVVKYLNEYASSVSLLVEFRDLASALFSLGAFLDGLSGEEIVTSSQKIVVYLRNISLDLIEWRSKVFVTQGTQDIHYLDSSLFSSCLQLQLDITSGAKNILDDDLGLELF